MVPSLLLGSALLRAATLTPLANPAARSLPFLIAQVLFRQRRVLEVAISC